MSTTLSTTRWTGIFPAITTKFHADESIDAEGTIRHIDFQIRNGIQGLVTCGSSGKPSRHVRWRTSRSPEIAAAHCSRSLRPLTQTVPRSIRSREE